MSLGVGVDIVVRGRGTAVDDREVAKGGGTRDEDWAGVEERDGTVEMGCFPLDEVAADIGSGFGDLGSSPGRDGVRCSGVRDKSAREVDRVADSRRSETCCSSSAVKSTARWFKYSQ
jgi:hypothetical protein